MITKGMIGILHLICGFSVSQDACWCTTIETTSIEWLSIVFVLIIWIHCYLAKIFQTFSVLRYQLVIEFHLSGGMVIEFKVIPFNFLGTI